MSTFTFPAMVDALRTQLLARTHMTGDTEIAVYTGPPSPEVANPRKAIMFIRCQDQAEPAGVGPQTQVNQKERYTVEGVIAGSSPLKGETGAKAARDACAGLLAELNQQLREDMTVNHTVEWAYVSTVDWEQGLDADRGRICLATFTISALALIAATPSGSWT
jgi:hypothetical protein